MSFGQQSGPPASDKQVRYLLSLVQQAGYTDLREARHPLALTQRQARGKFTRQEASELIDRLLAAEAPDQAPSDPAEPDPAGAPAAEAEAAPAPKRARTLREVPTERLVAELQRRGFRVVADDTDRPDRVPPQGFEP